MSIQNRISRFWRLLAEGDRDQVIAEIGEMGSIDPTAPGGGEVFYIWALALWKTGDVSEAMRRAIELLEARPRSASANRLLARILDGAEEFEASDRHFSRAWELAPDSSGVLVDWGRMLCRAEEHERAIEKLGQASRLGADDDSLHRYLGLSLECVGDLENARKELEIYVGRVRRDTLALGRLGLIYSDLGHYEKAEQLLRAAHDEDPEDLDNLYNLAICLKWLEQLDEAKSIAQRLTELSPDASEFWGLLGDVELQRGDLDGARRRYGRSLEINPMESYSLSGLAWISFQQGDLVEAQNISGLALAADSSNASALDVFRAARPKAVQLQRFAVDIRGEHDNGVRFFKSMECLADSEDQARDFIQDIQALFPRETWWELEEIAFVESIFDEHPGISWISDYDNLDQPGK